jgi:thiamine biosynthesis lipoprotein
VSFAQATWGVFGTTARLVVADGEADSVRDAVEAELARIDASCSRFRGDSELVRLNSAGGRPTRVSSLLLEAIEVALRGARDTDGAVDPTIGAAIAASGYDRDFASIPTDGPPTSAVPAPGWWRVEVDVDASAVRLPDAMRLDLGATAKALAADRAVAATRSVTQAGVLLSLGGDIAIAGPAPAGGWPVALDEDHRGPATGPVVGLRSGGLATSSTSVRQWRRGDQELTHILDPSTGAPCQRVWRTATVTAESCVAANVASTAVIVLADRGAGWLAATGLPGRLVGVDGRVRLLNGWPEARAA